VSNILNFDLLFTAIENILEYVKVGFKYVPNNPAQNFRHNELRRYRRNLRGFVQVDELF